MAGVNDTGCAGRGRLGAKQGAVGVLADADVQAEDAIAIQLGGAVKITIVLGDDRGERELASRWKLVARVVDKEGIAPGDFRRPSVAGGDDDIDAVKRLRDVPDD